MAGGFFLVLYNFFMDLFSFYQAGADLEETFSLAKRNELTYHGNHLANTTLTRCDNLALLQEEAIPSGAHDSFCAQVAKKGMPGTAFALPIAADDDFSWRELSIILTVEKEKIDLDKTDVYPLLYDHALVADEWISDLKILPLEEKSQLLKEQGTLCTEDVYLVFSHGRPDFQKFFPDQDSAEKEAVKRTEKEGGVFEVLALKQSSNGQPLFRCKFLSKRHHITTRFRLAQKNPHAKIIGWYFLGYLADDNA
jgi:hypothetical protein